MFRKIKGLQRSVRSRMLAMTVLMLLFFAILMVGNNLRAVNSMRQQVVEADRAILSMHMDSIDQSLSDVYSMLISFAGTDSDFGFYSIYTSQNDLVMAVSRMKESLSQQITSYNMIETLFIHSTKDDMYLSVSRDNDAGRSTTLKHRYQQLEGTGIFESNGRRKWLLQQVNGTNYFLGVLTVRDMCIGAWIPTGKVLIQPKESSFSTTKSTIFYVDGGYAPLSEAPVLEADEKINLNGDYSDFFFTGTNNRYFVVGVPSRQSDFILISLTEDKAVTGLFPFMTATYWWIGLGMLAVLSLNFIVIQWNVTLPIRRLVQTLRRIQSGKYDRAERPVETTAEFSLIYQVLDDMLQQISSLKIEVYEERLRTQAEKYELLKLQIKPHFFLNSINTVYRMAQLGRGEAIQEMALHLIAHYRYILDSNTDKVALSEEIAHVQNYIRIQQIRLSEDISIDVDIPDHLMITPIPPLIIQEAVENAMKYARIPQQPLRIRVTGTYESVDGGDGIRIRIEDNGPGFSRQVMAAIGQHEIVVKKDGSQHIGLWNISERLRHYYGETANLNVGTRPQGGAFFEVILPNRL